jgi:hypothetical protein
VSSDSRRPPRHHGTSRTTTSPPLRSRYGVPSTGPAGDGHTFGTDRARVAATFAVGDFSIEGLAAGRREVRFAQTGRRETTIYRLDTRSESFAPAFRIPDRSELDRQAPEPLALARETPTRFGLPSTGATASAGSTRGRTR